MILRKVLIHAVEPFTDTFPVDGNIAINIVTEFLLGDGATWASHAVARVPAKFGPNFSGADVSKVILDAVVNYPGTQASEDFDPEVWGTQPIPIGEVISFVQVAVAALKLA